MQGATGGEGGRLSRRGPCVRAVVRDGEDDARGSAGIRGEYAGVPTTARPPPTAL